MNYDLPTTVEVGGKEYKIRSDYRAALDIMVALTDSELSEQERAYAALYIFCPGLEDMPPECYQEAIDKCCLFINGGEMDSGKKAPRLVDWEQDFPRVAAPISRVLGEDIRGAEYLHWWTFLGAYMEIGDCLFAQIVNIRNKRAKGKKLDKLEQEFYRNNRDIIDIKQKYTETENNILDKWLGKTKGVGANGRNGENFH